MEDDLFAAWTFQDQRQDGDGRLVELLSHRSPQVRLQAARALGAIRSASYAGPLGHALAGDESSWVRHEATFALGQLSGFDHGDTLLPALTATEPSLRSLSATALGKVGSPEHLPLLVPLLGDPTAVVRGSAALGILGIAGDRYRGEQLREGIDATILTRVVAALVAQVRLETSPKAKWQETYALAHLAVPQGRDLIFELARAQPRDGDPNRRWVRLFAIHGLATLPADADLEAALSALLADGDPAIVIAAIRAAFAPRRLSGDNAPLTQLGPRLLDLLTSSPSVAVRDTAARELRKCPLIRIPLATIQAQDSISVTATAFETELLRSTPEEVSALWSKLAAAEHWLLQAVRARNLHRAPTDRMRLLAEGMQEQDDVRVILALLENLHLLPDPIGADICFRLADRRQPVIREALAGAVEKFAADHNQKASLTAALIGAYTESSGPSYGEARKESVRVVAEAKPASRATLRFLETALSDPVYVVRKQAAEQLAKLGRMDLAEQLRGPDDLFTPYPDSELPPGFLQSRPVVTLETSKGRVVISLFPQIAPIHCFNWMTLILRGDYDGREFHRVVPNFVIQGGSARPDGYANTAWHGGQLRDEINPLSFTSGVVGMPKSADPDSGGDQIFITIVPTPHLDGRYTAFGKVTEGMDVVESIEVGDIIQKTGVILH